MGRNNRNNFEKNKKALLVALLEKSKIQLKGSLIEKIKQQKIEENKQYLEDLKKRYSKYPLAYLLSGETEIGLENNYTLRLSTETRKKYKYLSTLSYAKTLDTGADYANLFFQPWKHKKIYISLLLNTKEKENQAEQFAVEIFDYCVDKKLALTYKTFDHNYDSLILYSEDYEVLESKLIECYHKYKKYDIFNTVPHFFQGTIPSVDVNHIGIVDEPPGGLNRNSFSTQMGCLGRLLDEGKGYEEACKQIGILPEAPWNINWKDPNIIEKYVEELRPEKGLSEK